MAIQKRQDGSIDIIDPSGLRPPVTLPPSEAPWIERVFGQAVSAPATQAMQAVPPQQPKPAPEISPVPPVAPVRPVQTPPQPDLNTAVGRFQANVSKLDEPFVRAEAQQVGDAAIQRTMEEPYVDWEVDQPATPAQPQTPRREDFYNVPNFALPPRLGPAGVAAVGEPGDYTGLNADDAAKLRAFDQAQADKNRTAAQLSGGSQTTGGPGQAGDPYGSFGNVPMNQSTEANHPLTLPPEAPASATPAPGIKGYDPSLADNGPPGVPQAGGQATGDGSTPEEQAAGFAGDVVRSDIASHMAPGGYSPPKPARDVLQSTRVEEKIANVSPETQGDIDAAEALRMRLAQQSGDQVRQAHILSGLAAAQAADKANARIRELKGQEATKQKMLDARMSYLDTKMKETREMAAVNPVERYWSRKGAMAKIMSRIGIALDVLGSAITKTPESVRQEIQSEIDEEVKFQARAVDANKELIGKELVLLGEMRQQMLTPEAAESATRSLLLEAVANEAKAQASLLQSEQARQGGLALAAQIQVDALRERAKTELANEKAVTQVLKHYEATSGGYAKQKSLADATAYVMKKFGLSFSDASRLVINNQLPKDKTDSRGKAAQMTEDREVLKRTVAVPAMIYDSDAKRFVPSSQYRGGMPRVLYGYSGEKSEGGAPLARAYLVEGGRYIRNLDRMIEIMSKMPTGQRIMPDAWSKFRGELADIISSNATLVKKLDLQEALTLGEFEGGPTIGNLTGKFALDRTASYDTIIDRLNKLRDEAVKARDNQLDQLMIDPYDPQNTLGHRRSAAPTSAQQEK